MVAVGVANKIIRLIVVCGFLAVGLLLSFQVFPIAIPQDSPAAHFAEDDFGLPATPALPQKQGSPVAVIRLSKVLPAHPRWPELRRLEESLLLEAVKAGQIVPAEYVPDLNAADLQQSLQRERERLVEEYQRQLAAQEKAKWAQATEQIERKKAQLKRELEAELTAKRNELTAELSSRTEALQKEYQLKIIGLRVRLELLDAADKARTELSREIDELRKELERRLVGLEQDYQAKLAQFHKQAETRYAERLQQFGNQLMAATEQELEAERQRLEAELAEHLSILSGTTAGESGGQSPETVQPRLAELAQAINMLRGSILADIRKAGEACAFNAGLKTVILTEEELFDGVDISEDVMAAIQKEGSLSNEARTTDNPE